MGRFYVIEVELGVVLECPEGRVPQQLLYMVEIGVGTHHFCGA